ncbi:MAG: hypothetical protein HQL77_15995 [Magnetococcales bacterium]|nr:hypothetical protein [Magnetococcales bacterium]
MEANDLPDLLKQSKQWKTHDQKKLTDRTAKAFCVPVAEIRGDGKYDLSINRNKETIYKEEQSVPPGEILDRMMDLEHDIMQDLNELKTLLEKEHAP